MRADLFHVGIDMMKLMIAFFKFFEQISELMTGSSQALRYDLL
jgi:hypothetical protein